MTLLDPSLAAFLSELATETNKIIDKHWENSEKNDTTLRHHGPFQVSISGVDGVIAHFMDDGMNLYPEEKSA